MTSQFHCFSRSKEIRNRKKVADAETPDQTRAGVWDLLANFTLVTDQTMEVVQREVDALLLALVDTDSGLGEKRDALLTDLARQATQGGSLIDSREFLRQHQLDSTPLTDWVGLRTSAAVCLDGDLSRAGYEYGLDVRAVGIVDLVQKWPPTAPLLVVSAESGTGKSWVLYALARLLASGQGLVLLTEATGDGDQDCQRAADLFWTRVKRNDNSIPLARIAARRRELVHSRADDWLTVLIDGVRSHQEARQLAKLPWEEWKVRVACSCLPEIARTLKAEARDRATVHEVMDFSPVELRCYLDLRLPGSWGRIPQDVRSTLRRPLLARLYSDLNPIGGWTPTSEYELYRSCWQRLREGDQGDHPMDIVPLHQLALAVLHGGKYPWAVGQLQTAGLTSEALARLCRVGWLQSVPPGRYQVWHDRLLNWAVAEALCEQHAEGQIDSQTLCSRVRRLLYAPMEGLARPLGYVPMDVLWLLCDPARGAEGAAEQLIEALETPP